MQRFRDYEETTGATIRSGWIVNDVSLTIGPRRTLITYSGNLLGSLALLGVATMVEVLGMNWPGERFRFRYPLASDDREEKQATARVRRDYRIPERRALRQLLPDWLLEKAEREEWEPWMLEEETGLEREAIARRMADWQAHRRGVIWLGACEDLDGPIPF